MIIASLKNSVLSVFDYSANLERASLKKKANISFVPFTVNSSLVFRNICSDICCSITEEVFFEIYLRNDVCTDCIVRYGECLFQTSSAEVSSLLSWVCWETVKNNEDTADADTQAFLFHSLASR